MLSLEGLRLGVGGQPMVLKWDVLLLKTSQGFETPGQAWSGRSMRKRATFCI